MNNVTGRASLYTQRKGITFSHTRWQALGPELIPVYRQSARRWLLKSSLAVGCHYFPPGLQSPSQPKNVAILRLCQVILFNYRGTSVWTTYPRMLRSFVSLGIETTTYWSQVQCLTATLLRHFSTLTELIDNNISIITRCLPGRRWNNDNGCGRRHHAGRRSTSTYWHDTLSTISYQKSCAVCHRHYIPYHNRQSSGSAMSIMLCFNADVK